MKNFILIVLFGVTFSACQSARNNGGPGIGQRSTSDSSFIMSLPSDGSMPADLLSKLTGYNLEITPAATNSCTNPTNFKKVAALNDRKLTAKIASGCDYNIVVELGSLATDSLDAVFLSNKVSTPNGTSLTSADIGTKTTVSKSISLTPTDDGTMAGFSNIQSPSTPPPQPTDPPSSTPQPQPTAPPSAGPQIVNIVVKDGYSPDVITLKKGVKAQLKFDRQEKSSCSSSVLIKDFGVSKALPAFQTTVIEITPDKTGEFKFTCGMQMIEGRIIVTE